MKMRTFFVFFTAMVFAIAAAGTSFSSHKEEKGTVQGSVIKIEAIEYEMTVKDDKGKETKTRVKDIADIKVGDSVIIRDGKASKAVKPRTGGY